MTESGNNISGKITYIQSDLPENRESDVSSFLGFNDKGKNWYVYSISFFKERTAELFREADLQFYRPTYEAVDGKKSKTPRRVLKSKTLNYVFVPATEAQVLEFSRLNDITPIYRRHTKQELAELQRTQGKTALNRVKIEEELFRLKEAMDAEGIPAQQMATIKLKYKKTLNEYNQKYANTQETLSSRFTIIPHRQMYSLMIVVEGLEHEVEFTTPSEQLLNKGDKVRVMSGVFAGVEGILITNQGSRKGGRIFISVTKDNGAYTAQIPDECIQVLEFSRANNHVTRKFKAVESLLESCFEARSCNGMLTPQQKASLEFILMRYSRLSNLTTLNEAKLTAYRYVAHTLLNQHYEAEEALLAFVQKTQNNKECRENVRRSPAAVKIIEDWQKRLCSLA